MISTNVAFKGHTYIKGCHPQEELNTDKSMTWRDQMLIRLALEEKDTLELIKENKPSNLDICLTRTSATIEYIPKKGKDAVDDGPVKPKVLKTFKKGFFESMEGFYKDVLTYAVENRGKLSQQTRNVKTEDLYGKVDNQLFGVKWPF